MIHQKPLTPPRPAGTASRLAAPRRRWRRHAVIAAAISLGLGGGVTGSLDDAAFADDYPSWQDVQEAKQNEAAGAAKVTQIENLIAGLQTKVEDTQAVAEQRGAELQVAQGKFDDADRKATELEAQAGDAARTAAEAQAQAARLTAQLYKSGGRNMTSQIFFGSGKATTTAGEQKQGSAKPDGLLSQLGNISQLSERTQSIFTRAETAKNLSQALSKQATTAKQVRTTLRDAAQAALTAATSAAVAAQSALTEQQANIVVLQAQLDALKDTTTKTVQSYQDGVAARAAAANASGAGAGLPGGYVSDQGWAVPAEGPITDGYGPRVSPCSGCSSWHYGIDIGAGGGAPIYAAHDGVVVYAGPNGSYGNFVLIDNGGGISTGYAHIRPGGIFVGVGQRVGVGENIASVGTTGASTGYHLHYEVRIDGKPIDGIPFMAQRGAPLG
jgi:murein DD-endopeptidase MepM/ murein hydrolase activator NlpD